MGKKSGPAPPDYSALAEQQAQGNQQQLAAQTFANRPNQTNPFGSVNWQAKQSVDPATGKPVTSWEQTTTLDPDSQRALDAQQALQAGRGELAQGMLGNVQSSMGTPMDWSRFGSAAPGAQGANVSAITTANMPGGADTARQRAEQAIYQQASSRLDPQWQQRQSQLETQLANSGISRNSAAYSQAMQDLNQQRSDAYNQAQMSAITGGGAEAQREQGMLLGQQAQAYQQAAGASGQNYQQQQAQIAYDNQMRTQAMNEAMLQRGYSLSEINSLLGGQGIAGPQFQDFTGAGYTGGADLTGAAQQSYDAQYQQQKNRNAGTGQILGAIGGAAGAFFGGPAGAMAGYSLGNAVGSSDRRLKRNVRRIGTHPRGFGIYRFRFVGERSSRVGVIAQEVQRLMPEAVVRRPGGVLAVKYAML